MASIPCTTHQNRPGCPCDDNPLYNLSSELSDGPSYNSFVPVPPIYLPQPGNPTEPGVPVICTSYVSQDEADLCGSNGTVPPPYVPPPVNPTNPIEPPQPPDNPPTTPGDPNIPGPTNPGQPTNPPSEGFWNTESNCIAFCPDNVTSATAQIPAHTILGTTQAEADLISSNACIALARSRLVCFDPPSEGTVVNLCADVAASITCVVSGQVLSIDMTGLPPGMTFSCADTGICTISGTPACGNYDVTVTATTATTPPVSFTFHMHVLGILCTLPDASMDTPYSATVTGCGGTAPYTFGAVDIGNGLVMDVDGTVHGTPIGITGCPQTLPFSVTITDSDGNSCSKNCSVTVSALCNCIHLDNMQDDGSSSGQTLGASASFAITPGSSPQITWNLSSEAQPPNPSKSSNVALLVSINKDYPAAHGKCCVQFHIHITGTNMGGGPDPNNTCSIVITGHSSTLYSNLTIFGPLDVTFTDTMPVGSQYYQITVNSQCGPGSPPTLAKSQQGYIAVSLLNDGDCPP